MEPVFSQAIIGYRYWIFRNEKLSSVVRFHSWEESIEKSSCSIFLNHSPPEEDCECGLYAYFDLERVKKSIIASNKIWEYFWGPDYNGEATKIVIGLIAARGKIALHHDGFKAEEAQILLLSDIDRLTENDYKALKNTSSALDKKDREIIESRYGVEVLSLDGFEEKSKKIASQHSLLKRRDIKAVIPDRREMYESKLNFRYAAAHFILMFLALNSFWFIAGVLGIDRVGALEINATQLVFVTAVASFFFAVSLHSKRVAKGAD